MAHIFMFLLNFQVFALLVTSSPPPPPPPRSVSHLQRLPFSTNELNSLSHETPDRPGIETLSLPSCTIMLTIFMRPVAWPTASFSVNLPAHRFQFIRIHGVTNTSVADIHGIPDFECNFERCKRLSDDQTIITIRATRSSQIHLEEFEDGKNNLGIWQPKEGAFFLDSVLFHIKFIGESSQDGFTITESTESGELLVAQVKPFGGGYFLRYFPYHSMHNPQKMNENCDAVLKSKLPDVFLFAITTFMQSPTFQSISRRDHILPRIWDKFIFQAKRSTMNYPSDLYTMHDVFKRSNLFDISLANRMIYLADHHIQPLFYRVSQNLLKLRLHIHSLSHLELNVGNSADVFLSEKLVLWQEKLFSISLQWDEISLSLDGDRVGVLQRQRAPISPQASSRFTKRLIDPLTIVVLTTAACQVLSAATEFFSGWLTYRTARVNFKSNMYSLEFNRNILQNGNFGNAAPRANSSNTESGPTGTASERITLRPSTSNPVAIFADTSSSSKKDYTCLSALNSASSVPSSTPGDQEGDEFEALVLSRCFSRSSQTSIFNDPDTRESIRQLLKSCNNNSPENSVSQSDGADKWILDLRNDVPIELGVLLFVLYHDHI